MSGWALSDAIARCLARRGLAGLRAAPIPATLGLVALAAAPLLMVRAGSALGAAIASALEDGRSARVVVTTIVALASLGGATVSLGLPRRDGLSPEIAVAPLSERRLLWATWLPPLALVLAAAAPSTLGLLLPLAASSPGGWPAAPALVVAGMAGALIGAAAAEVGRATVNGDAAGVLGALALTGCWLAAGALSGAVAFGPLDAVGRVVAGEGGAMPALAALLLVCGGASGVWATCAPRARRSRGSRQPRVVAPAWRSPVSVTIASVLVLLTRRPDVRIALVLAAAAAAATLVLGRIAGAPWELAATIASLTAALASAPLPLAVGGALLDGRWLWQTTRLRSPVVAAGWSVAACGGLMLVVASIAVPGLVSSGLDVAAIGPIAVAGVLVAACALLAGALVPYRDGAVGDQVPSIAALLVVLASAGVLAEEVGARLADLGLSDVVAGAAPVVAVLALAWAAVAVRAARVA